MKRRAVWLAVGNKYWIRTDREGKENLLVRYILSKDHYLVVKTHISGQRQEYVLQVQASTTEKEIKRLASDWAAGTVRFINNTRTLRSSKHRTGKAASDRVVADWEDRCSK